MRRPVRTSEKAATFVAVVDDNESMRGALVGLIRATGLCACSFASAEEFLNSGRLDQAGCLIADIRMPGMSGLELQARLNDERRRIPVIFVTVDGDASTRKQALSAGAVELFTKPFDDEALLECVRTALKVEPWKA